MAICLSAAKQSSFLKARCWFSYPYELESGQLIDRLPDHRLFRFRKFRPLFGHLERICLTRSGRIHHHHC
jgi:hypothetical protein